MGLVGESGCGKTTIGKILARLLDPTDGRIYIQGRNIFELKGEELDRFNREIQIIFQDPYGSLNPRMTVENVIGEGLAIHKLMNPVKRREKVK